MPFQSTVRLDQTDAIIAEIIFSGPTLAEPKILNSTSAANNVFGRAFQQVTGAGNDDEVSADIGSAAVFAGIMVSPKEHALLGTTAGTLEPSITLPNNQGATFLKIGTTVVSLPAAANIGDELFYDFRDGTIMSQAPGGNTPANHARVPGGVVVRENIPAAGLAYVTIGG